MIGRLKIWIRALRIFASRFPLAPEQAPRWGEADQENLTQFMKTSTGQKLVMLMRYNEQAANVGAVMTRSNCEFECGYASGFRSCAAWIFSLSAFRSPQEAEDIQTLPRGAEELFESLAP